VSVALTVLTVGCSNVTVYILCLLFIFQQVAGMCVHDEQHVELCCWLLIC
jgi:hypothetical protein